MGRLFVIVSLLGLLVAVVVFVVASWQQMGAVEMSGAGVGSLIVGVILSLVVGGGLMALVFYSSRRGYDDEAGKRTSRSRDHDPRD